MIFWVGGCVCVCVRMSADTPTGAWNIHKWCDRRGQVRKDAVMPWGMFTLVFLTAEFETARLQITVPRKIETNTKDGSISETHVINKSL